MSKTKLKRAIRHAVNYHGLDAKLNMADYEIADLLIEEMQKHLEGRTDVQIVESLTPAELAERMKALA